MLLFKPVILILSLANSMQIYSQPLTGIWRRVNPALKVQDTITKQLKYGDLKLSEDSTFHIEGDSTTNNSAMSGWHTGEERNGTWRLNGNRIVLYYEPKDDNLFLCFIIIKLTANNLVLEDGFSKKHKRNKITYLRL